MGMLIAVFSKAGGNDAIGVVVVVLGYGLLLVLAFLAGAIFWPIPYMIADRTHGTFAAVIEGPKLALANLKLSALLVLVNAGLVFVGELACVVGLIFSYSLSFVLFAVAYDRLARAARDA
jgi:uncharacterized membrane protein